MGLGTTLFFAALAIVAAIVMAVSDAIAAGLGSLTGQELAAAGFAAAMLFGAVSVVAVHLYSS